MSIIKLILLIGYIFQLCISKNIERIEFINNVHILNTKNHLNKRIYFFYDIDFFN